MMAGEIQEPFNLSLLENSIHSGSVSFGRFEKEALSWEKRSSFSHNRYLEEAEKFSKPGSVTQMRAHFEAHFKTKGIRFPSPVEARTWGEVVDRHHQIGTEKKDENLWESTSQYSNYSYEQEKSQFGDSCVSYEEILVISDDHDHSSLSVALDKTEIGYSTEMTREDKEETTSSSATRPKPLKMVKKASPCSVVTKASTKKHVVITKGAPSCNTNTKREKELKPKRIVTSIAAKSPASKKTESLTPLVTKKLKSKNCVNSATREKKTTFSFRSSERAEKRKEEKVETVLRKALNFKARPMPECTQARPQHTSKGQVKARDDAQERSSKASCDRSSANGPAKSKLNVSKEKADLERSLKGTRSKSSDQTVRNNANRRSLAVRRSAFEVAL